MSNEIEQLNSDLNEYVQTAKQMYIGLNKHALQTYWELGRIVSEIDTKYGESSIKSFADNLSKEVGRNDTISATSLYRCRQFQRKHNADEVEKMAEQGITWTQVIKTLPLPKEDVTSTVALIESGELDPSNLSDRAITTSRGGGASPPGGYDYSDNEEPEKIKKVTSNVTGEKPPVKKIEKLKDDCVSVMEQFADIWLIADEYDEIPEDVNDELHKLYRALSEVKEAADEAITFLGGLLSDDVVE